MAASSPKPLRPGKVYCFEALGPLEASCPLKGVAVRTPQAPLRVMKAEAGPRLLVTLQVFVGG